VTKDLSTKSGRRCEDITGHTFGRLTVVEFSGYRDRYRYWKCLCDCGLTKTVQETHLRNSHTQSCGCLRLERATASNTTHGMAKSREYACWLNMKNRCNNPKHQVYHQYGGRGISVCPRWNDSFRAFHADMGTMPEGLELERLDNNAGYGPDNCTWADRVTQMMNRRNTLTDIICDGCGCTFRPKQRRPCKRSFCSWDCFILHR